MEWGHPASYRKHTTKEQGVLNTSLKVQVSDHRNRCGIGRIVHTTLQTAMDGVLGSKTLKPGTAWL